MSEQLPSENSGSSPPEHDSFNIDNVVYLHEIDQELARRKEEKSRARNNELAVRYRDKLDSRKTIKIVGTAGAILLALGGLYAISKKRKH